jgi:hypothetical protein
VLHAIEEEANLAISRGGASEITYTGTQPLAIGVELIELTLIN